MACFEATPQTDPGVGRVTAGDEADKGGEGSQRGSSGAGDDNDSSSSSNNSNDDVPVEPAGREANHLAGAWGRSTEDFSG